MSSMNKEMTMWEDDSRLLQIRKLFAPTLNEVEFETLVGIGKATNLNPFLREIWAVKYKPDSPAQIFIGRDGYRKAAQSHAAYDFHLVDAVYENDDFEVINGQVSHKYKLMNRGALVGAYAIAKRHKSSRPNYVFVNFHEYNTNLSLWKSKPATMIKKVAESQCLRSCFQDLLGGTYSEEEYNPVQEEGRIIDCVAIESGTEGLKNILREKIDVHAKDCDLDNGHGNKPDSSEWNDCLPPHKNTADGRISEAVDRNAGSRDDDMRSTPEQLKAIDALFKSKEFSEERIQKALNYYRISSLDELTHSQATSFLSQLERAQ